jgi:putative oxidoreductase
MFGRAGSEPQPIIPALGHYYGFTSDFAYLVVRLTAGLMLFWHGWGKLTGAGVAGTTAYMTKLGIAPAELFAYVLIINETVVALMITFGLLTRLAAIAVIIEFIVLIFMVHVPRGYGMAVNGVEFPLMWLMILVAIALRGGGPYSLDRTIGKEF